MEEADAELMQADVIAAPWRRSLGKARGCRRGDGGGTEEKKRRCASMALIRNTAGSL
jgi:hypothetical protein